MVAWAVTCGYMDRMAYAITARFLASKALRKCYGQPATGYTTADVPPSMLMATPVR